MIGFEILTTIVISLLSVIVGIVGFMFKRLHDRIQHLEKRNCDTVTRREAKEMVDDKLKPIQQQIESVDSKLDRIIAIMLSGGRGDK